MFERFAQFVGRRDLPNDFYPVQPGDITDAEARMGLKFPDQLRLFFQEAGCGFYRLGTKDTELRRSLINGILDPGTIAELVCEPEHPWRPQGGPLNAGEMPFFDMGDRDYLLVNALSENPNQVLWQGGSVMTGSIIEFFDLLYDHAGFYAGGPGSF